MTVDNNTYKTVKEFATLQSVTTQAVYNRLKSDLKPYIKEIGGKRYINYAEYLKDNGTPDIANELQTDCKVNCKELQTLANELQSVANELQITKIRYEELEKRYAELKETKERYYNMYLSAEEKREKAQDTIEDLALKQGEALKNSQTLHLLDTPQRKLFGIFPRKIKQDGDN